MERSYYFAFYNVRDDQTPELGLGNQDSTSRRYLALVLFISSYSLFLGDILSFDKSWISANDFRLEE
jgi:hypothetical protein